MEEPCAPSERQRGREGGRRGKEGNPVLLFVLSRQLYLLLLLKCSIASMPLSQVVICLQSTKVCNWIHRGVNSGGVFGSLGGACASVFHWLCLLKLLIVDYYSRPGDTPWPNSRMREIRGAPIHHFFPHCRLGFLSKQRPGSRSRINPVGRRMAQVRISPNVSDYISFMELGFIYFWAQNGKSKKIILRVMNVRLVIVSVNE